MRPRPERGAPFAIAPWSRQCVLPRAPPRTRPLRIPLRPSARHAARDPRAARRLDAGARPGVLAIDHAATPPVVGRRRLSTCPAVRDPDPFSCAHDLDRLPVNRRSGRLPRVRYERPPAVQRSVQATVSASFVRRRAGGIAPAFRDPGEGRIRACRGSLGHARSASFEQRQSIPHTRPVGPAASVSEMVVQAIRSSSQIRRICRSSVASRLRSVTGRSRRNRSGCGG